MTMLTALPHVPHYDTAAASTTDAAVFHAMQGAPAIWYHIPAFWAPISVSM